MFPYECVRGAVCGDVMIYIYDVRLYNIIYYNNLIFNQYFIFLNFKFSPSCMNFHIFLRITYVVLS